MTKLVRATICIDVNAEDSVDLEETIERWYKEIEHTTASGHADPLLQNWDVCIEPVKEDMFVCHKQGGKLVTEACDGCDCIWGAV